MMQISQQESGGGKDTLALGFFVFLFFLFFFPGADRSQIKGCGRIASLSAGLALRVLGSSLCC